MAARAEPLEPVAAGFEAPSRGRAAVGWLEREALTVAIASLYGIVLLLALPGELVQDSWSTLASGREIAQNGLPHRESLTAMAHGVRWVDQQWLAQVAFYELFRAGGYRLIVLVHVALIGSAFALALVYARRRGASQVAVFLVGALCFFVAPWGWQLRAQSFAPLLFVAVLWLLAADSRAGSRRVLLVLPLLALWANLHGSVVLAALLVALYGGLSLLERRGRSVDGALLVAGAPLAVLCSPYGLSLVGYYHDLLVDPPFGRLVNEWSAPTPGPVTAMFYVLAFVATWAAGRRWRALTTFELLALLVTLVSALHAARNIVWFGLATLMLVPTLLESRRQEARPAAARAGLALAVVTVLAAVLAYSASRPASSYQHLWPEERALAAVAAATAGPGTRVFASDRDADWLLWRLPELRGRVAFDVRFELNTPGQIRRIHDFFERIGPHWQDAARGYDVIVLNREHHDAVRRSLLRTSALHQAFADEDLAVLVRRGSAGG